MGIFTDLLQSHGVATRETMGSFSIVPTAKVRSKRDGSHLQDEARKVGDLTYWAMVAVSSVVYKKIDEQHPHRFLVEAEKATHDRKFKAARDILNENRNQVFEQILPNYEITRRSANYVETEADRLAFDLIVNNVFRVFTRTTLSWIPEFVPETEVPRLKEIVAGVADTQYEKLSGELKNFAFRARPVLAPQE